MNWENSKCCTPLKRDILKAFFVGGNNFFLTGGSALGIFYLEHRLSYDLDLFTTEPMDGHRIENELLRIAEEIGSSSRTLQVSPDFRRYEMQRGEEKEIVDFVFERVEQIYPEKTLFGQIRVDTIREIFINKICTLVSRCEVKDIIDLFFLAKAGHQISDCFEDARKKEGGLDPATVSWLLSQVQVGDIQSYLVKPLSTDELQQFIDSLQVLMTKMSWPE